MTLYRHGSGAIMLPSWPDGSREEMWDCDEVTYTSYLENLAKVIQEWESSEGGE